MNEVFVKTYICDGAVRKNDGAFVLLRDNFRIHKRTIEGAIELKIGETTLLDTSFWDEITCLWSYLVTAIDELTRSNKSSFYFPDQPILVSFESIANKKLKISVHGKSAVTAKRSAILIMLQEALRFFEILRLSRYHSGVEVTECVRIRELIGRVSLWDED